MLVPKKMLIAGVAAVFAVGGAGAAMAATMQKEVTLVVDGQSSKITGYLTTAGDVLNKNGVSLEQRDTVQPTADAQLKNGETIIVTRIRAKQVTVAHDGTTSTLATFSSTVAGALYDAGVSVGISDRVSPEITESLTEGQAISVKRVVITSAESTEPVAFTSSTVKDPEVEKGKTKVTTQGVDGVKTSIFQVVTVDGVEESRTLVSETSTPAVNQVTTVGTKVAETVAAPAPAATKAAAVASTPTQADDSADTGDSGDGLDLSHSAMWDKVAKCESGGNWAINTGNGYYGGLQFRTSTWLGAGGGQYASRADLASRAEQITIANRIYASSGLSQWGCKA